MREQGQGYRKPHGGRRGNGYHRGGYRGNDAPVAQDNEPRDDGNANDGGRFKKKFIRRDNEDGGRFNRRGGENRGRGGDRRGGRVEDRDLDRQLRDYWITTKGGEKAAEGIELAREKLNSEMDSYWKNKKEEEKKAE